MERAEIRFGDIVLVASCGPIGLGLIACARKRNPLTLIARDPDDDKLALDCFCGADITINIRKEDAVARADKISDSYGADVHLEGTSHPSAVVQSLTLSREVAYVEYTVFCADVTADWSIISDDKELDVRDARLGSHCWPAAVKMLEERKIPVADICTHQMALVDFQKTLDLVGDSSGAPVKVSI